MTQRKIKDITTAVFSGGADIRHQNEPALIVSGGYSTMQNMRNMQPGLRKRPGCIKLHGTADSTNRVMSMYQFAKGKKTERHFFAQMSDSDVLEAYANPPSVVELMNVDWPPPTTTYATWDASNKGNGITLSGGGLIATRSSGTGFNVQSTIPITGKVYFEMTHTALTVYAGPGVCNSSFSISGTTIIGSDVATNSARWMSGGGSWYFGNSTVASGPNFTATNVCMVAIDADTGDIWLGVNGTWYGSGNPATGANPTITSTNLPAGDLYACWFGNNETDSVTTNFGASAFGYTVPSGFKSGLYVLSNVTPPWSTGDTITGVSSTVTCSVVDYVSETQYRIKDRSGTYTLGEVLTNGTYTADQGSTKPTFTASAFGTEVFSGKANPVPASWANINDYLLFCNGVDTPQIYPGTGQYVEEFYLYQSSLDPLTTTVYSGTDYSIEVSDGDSSTYADVSGMKTLDVTYTELVINGTFANDTSWTKTGVAKITGGALDMDGEGSAYQSITLEIGRYYKRSVDVTSAASTEYETFTIDTLPIGGWNTNDTITGLSSGNTCKLYSGSVPTWIITDRSGDFTDGEVLTNGSKQADQGTGYPLVTAIDDCTLSVSPDGELITTAGTHEKLFQYSAGSKAELEHITKSHLTIDNFSIKKIDYECILIKTPLPTHSLGFELSSFNGNAAVANVKYWDGDSFADVSGFSDGTSDGTKTLSKDGSMTWTAPSDEQETQLYAVTGYWYLVYLTSGSLDSDTKITSVTFESGWQSIKNIWDGVWREGILAVRYIGGVRSEGATNLGLAGFGADSADALYLATYDDIDSIQISFPTEEYNVTSGATLSLYKWTGSAWEEVSITDQTDGFMKSGKILFSRISSASQSFENTGFMAKWFKITSDTELSTGTFVEFKFQPYFNISDIGKGVTVDSWKSRAVYGTDQDHILYVSAENAPQVLNGDDSGILVSGDGRYNRPVSVRNFKDSLLVLQEEKGKDGGCLTKFAWATSVLDTVKTIISTHFGAMNNNCVDVVDGIESPELNRDIPVMTLAFCLSRYGIYVTDGNTCYRIDKDIENYFDPKDSTCIRAGYESLMWLKYDSAFNVIRVGLVSGSSATLPNVFPVYDIKTKTWSVDSLAQEFSCMTEVEAASGSVPVLQIGGGVDDGTVYLSNTGLNDVSTAIDSYATLEFDGQGNQIHMGDILIRAKAQSAGTITITPSLNGIAQTSFTFSQTVEITNQKHRRNRKNINLIGDHISIKIQHNTASEDCYLLDHGEGIEIYGEQ